jgi:hypothetical protein
VPVEVVFAGTSTTTSRIFAIRMKITVVELLLIQPICVTGVRVTLHFSGVGKREGAVEALVWFRPFCIVWTVVRR